MCRVYFSTQKGVFLINPTGFSDHQIRVADMLKNCGIKAAQCIKNLCNKATILSKPEFNDFSKRELINEIIETSKKYENKFIKMLNGESLDNYIINEMVKKISIIKYNFKINCVASSYGFESVNISITFINNPINGDKYIININECETSNLITHLILNSKNGKKYWGLSSELINCYTHRNIYHKNDVLYERDMYELDNFYGFEFKKCNNIRLFNYWLKDEIVKPIEIQSKVFMEQLPHYHLMELIYIKTYSLSLEYKKNNYEKHKKLLNLMLMHDMMNV